MANNNELKHWGIPGMKWYNRRYQYKDGSLTPAGRERYGSKSKSPSDKEIARYGTKSNYNKVQRAKKAASPEKLEKIKQRIAGEENTKAELEKYKKMVEDAKKPKTEIKLKTEKDSAKETKPLSIEERIKNMSDQELQAAVNRINNEKTLRQYYKSIEETPVSQVNENQVSKGKKVAKYVWDKVLLPAVTEASKDQLKTYLNKQIGTAIGNAKKEPAKENKNKKKQEA